MSAEPQPWFLFRIEDSDEAGIEPPKLARLLTEMSAAFYAIARMQIDETPTRPGRRTYQEEAIAGARIKSIIPGSTTIELAPPAAADQARLFQDEPDADSVISTFAEEIENIEQDVPPDPSRWEVRHRVRAVLERAGDIGSRGMIAYNPRPGRSGREMRSVLTTFRIRDLPAENPRSQPWVVRHQLSGRAYMADVEPGRERMRLKLSNGRDVTLDVAPDAVHEIKGNLEKLVEVDVVQTMEGDAPSKRMVESARALPDMEEPNDIPPRTLDEIETDLKLPRRVNYEALATAVWRTPEEVEEFMSHVSEIRRPASVASRDDG